MVKGAGSELAVSEVTTRAMCLDNAGVSHAKPFGIVSQQPAGNKLGALATVLLAHRGMAHLVETPWSAKDGNSEGNIRRKGKFDRHDWERTVAVPAWRGCFADAKSLHDHCGLVQYWAKVCGMRFTLDLACLRRSTWTRGAQIRRMWANVSFRPRSGGPTAN